MLSRHWVKYYFCWGMWWLSDGRVLFSVKGFLSSSSSSSWWAQNKCGGRDLTVRFVCVTDSGQKWNKRIYCISQNITSNSEAKIVSFGKLCWKFKQYRPVITCNSFLRPDECNIGCDGLGTQHSSRNSESIRHLLIARWQDNRSMLYIQAPSCARTRVLQSSEEDRCCVTMISRRSPLVGRLMI
jgi:hypothetical protein